MTTLLYSAQIFKTQFPQRPLRNYKSYLLEISRHSVFTYAIWWDLFFSKSDDNFSLNDNFTYYVYSHQSGVITGEHCVTDIMLYKHERVETMGVIAN